MPESIALRPGQPTAQDGLAFARYLDIAAEGAFSAMLGRQAHRIIAEAYEVRGHDLSFAHTLFAELDGGIVGMASGYTADEHHRSSDDALKSAAGIQSLRMGALTMLGRGLFRFIETVPDGDFYLQAVAVDDERRGLGIGTRLIDQLEHRAREEDCARIALDVSTKNESARRLYERRGMTVEAESPRFLFIPGTSAVRMVKVL